MAEVINPGQKGGEEDSSKPIICLAGWFYTDEVVKSKETFIPYKKLKVILAKKYGITFVPPSEIAGSCTSKASRLCTTRTSSKSG